MVTPQRAPVVPRVRVGASDIVLPIDGAVDEILSRDRRIIILIDGPPCSGKSTALAHVAAHLKGRSGIAFADSPNHLHARRRGEDVLICTGGLPPQIVNAVILHLVPWTDDDVIEYLLARHRKQVDSVMSQVLADPARSALRGSPFLWVRALDEMAQSRFDSVIGALSQSLQREVSADAWAAIRDAAIMATEPQPAPDTVLSWRPREFPRQWAQCAWMSRAFRVQLAAARWIERLEGEEWNPLFLECPTPLDVVRQAAQGPWQRKQRASSRLRAAAQSGHARLHPAAVSFLAAIDPAWKPEKRRELPLNLRGAVCPGVDWSRCHLKFASLHGADFSKTNLSNSDLSLANLAGANLRRANLRGAALDGSIATHACFEGADMQRASLENANWGSAHLNGARLDFACLENASLYAASVAGAQFRRADLIGVDLRHADIAGADFAGAILMRADLRGLALRTASFEGADFSFARLLGCDLSEMSLPGVSFELARLTGALFTASFMPGACFARADLANAKLADVQWEQANLRGANLRGATFHMGSSRSGLVFSPFASEGSRTGFYTDELNEQDFKSPEEIRKANLRGADLRDAVIEGVDFYLVDLRDAIYSWQQEKIFRASGAILETRV